MTSDTANPGYNQALELLLTLLLEQTDLQTLKKGWVLRDSSGRLGFISGDDFPSTDNLEETLRKHLGPYAREDKLVVSIEHPGMTSLVRNGRIYSHSIRVGDPSLGTVRVIDQRIVGADWLMEPAAAQPGRLVFASIKGGVGRSTALAVTAADMASEGRKVLVIDLDLEAPGIGSLLLPPQGDLPRFGMLDALIEQAVAGLDDSDLLDMVQPSPFGAGRGLIDVVPAVGSIANQFPADVLGKLARTYIETTDKDGNLLSFTQQVSYLVDALCRLKTYDAVLIDARAGLNESTAAAILGLGAQVLLFAEDTTQTLAGYRYLFAHLARLPRQKTNDWLPRLKMIHAKAPANEDEQQIFRDRLFELFQEFLYRDAPLDAEDSSSVDMNEYSLDDIEAPHFAVPVYFDGSYLRFDPLANQHLMGHSIYQRTYGELLDLLNPARLFETVSDAK